VSAPVALVFSREYPPVTVGGTSTVARDVARGLVRQGWRVGVASTVPAGEPDRHDVAAGVSVYRVGSERVYERDTRGPGVLVTHRRLLRAGEALVEQLGPPAVVLLPDLFCLPEALLLASRAGAPVVQVLLQDFRRLTPYDRDAHRVTTGVSAAAADLLALEDRALRECAHTVFISRALSAAIVADHPEVAAATSVIPLGVDRAELAEVAAARGVGAELRSGLPPDARQRPLVVGVGRLVPVKGYAPLLRALALLAAPPQLVLVGVGPEEEPLRRLSAELGLAGRVTFAGAVLRRTALAWMSAADLGVVPSLWESFCYVCAELMALGRPVVASHVDSLCELMPSAAYGFPVPVAGPPGRRSLDPADLAAGLDAALSDPSAARTRGTAGRDRILSEFSTDRFAGRLDALCRAVAGV
jgi:glycosyltransferase involved in cell wall biosynthesis